MRKFLLTFGGTMMKNIRFLFVFILFAWSSGFANTTYQELINILGGENQTPVLEKVQADPNTRDLMITSEMVKKSTNKGYVRGMDNLNRPFIAFLWQHSDSNSLSSSSVPLDKTTYVETLYQEDPNNEESWVFSTHNSSLFSDNDNGVVSDEKGKKPNKVTIESIRENIRTLMSGKSISLANKRGWGVLSSANDNSSISSSSSSSGSPGIEASSSNSTPKSSIPKVLCIGVNISIFSANTKSRIKEIIGTAYFNSQNPSVELTLFDMSGYGPVSTNILNYLSSNKYDFVIVWYFNVYGGDERINTYLPMDNIANVLAALKIPQTRCIFIGNMTKYPGTGDWERLPSSIDLETDTPVDYATKLYLCSYSQLTNLVNSNDGTWSSCELGKMLQEEIATKSGSASSSSSSTASTCVATSSSSSSLPSSSSSSSTSTAVVPLKVLFITTTTPVNDDLSSYMEQTIDKASSSLRSIFPSVQLNSHTVTNAPLSTKLLHDLSFANDDLVIVWYRNSYGSEERFDTYFPTDNIARILSLPNISTKHRIVIGNYSSQHKELPRIISLVSDTGQNIYCPQLTSHFTDSCSGYELVADLKPIIEDAAEIRTQNTPSPMNLRTYLLRK